MSRCMRFRFKPIPWKAQIDKIKYICVQEKIEYSEETLKALIEISGGDMRKSISMLQFASIGKNKKLSLEKITDIAGLVNGLDLEKMMHACRYGSEMDVKNAAKNAQYQGYSSGALLSQLLSKVQSIELDDITKAQCSMIFSETEKRLISDGSEPLNIEFILLKLSCLIKKREKEMQ